MPLVSRGVQDEARPWRAARHHGALERHPRTPFEGAAVFNQFRQPPWSFTRRMVNFDKGAPVYPELSRDDSPSPHTPPSSPCPSSVSGFRVCESSASGGHPRVTITFQWIGSEGEKKGRYGVAAGVVADTGAQVCLIPLQKFVALGLPRSALTFSKRPIEAANGARLDVIGWSDSVMSSPTATGGTMSTTQSLYVVRGVDEAYLSCNALMGLGMVNRDFPLAGAAANQGGQECRVAAVAAIGVNICKCPPGRCLRRCPTLMKQWLLDRFAASTFNKCTHAPPPGDGGPRTGNTHQTRRPAVQGVDAVHSAVALAGAG